MGPATPQRAPGGILLLTIMIRHLLGRAPARRGLKHTLQLAAVLAACSSLIGAAPRPTSEPKKPKLVLAIAIDQFRYDYLTRFRSNYSGGMDRLLRRGAVFTNARYQHFPTVTAIGHSVFMSGATPSLSGIVGNEWFDREAGKQVTSVSDPATRLLGGKGGTGSSPRRLLVSTLGDELKIASRGKCRVIGVSLKDRAAILPSGHICDGAYWFDSETGNFVSSTFYFADLPQWVKDFNRSRFPDRYLNAEWKPLVGGSDYQSFFRKMTGVPGAAFYNSLDASPYSNELLEAFAERAIESEQIGRHGAADLLTLSFSANDYVGHQVGPDAPEVRDMAIRVDRTIGKLLEFVDKQAGLENTVIVLTGDHGVAPLPEVLAEEKMPGGRASGKAVLEAIQTALSVRFGDGKWVVAGSPGPYLDHQLIHDKKLKEAEVESVAAEAVSRVPHVFRVYTREDLLHGRVIDDVITREVVNGFYPARASDLVVIGEPYWIDAARGTTHGSPFMYDSHVPVILMGPNVKAGRYDFTIAPNDIAPTLATMLDVETPSGAMGRVLTEMLVAQ
jgi:predicted AlkP superfamily pyrophosphatase or phosphodiesterase